MEEKKAGLDVLINDEYSSTVVGISASELSEPKSSILRCNVVEINSQIDGRANDCIKLENERKILAFHK